MIFFYGNFFRLGENYVDLGRIGFYYFGNSYRGYIIYLIYGISNMYNRLFGGGFFFGLIGGNNYGGYFFGGYLMGNIGGGFLGRFFGCK